jgi:hypothetical protein
MAEAMMILGTIVESGAQLSTAPMYVCDGIVHVGEILQPTGTNWNQLEPTATNST